MLFENNRPAVYVGTYGKYNSGSLYGAWMKPGDYDTYEDFMEACRELHKDEPIGQMELMFQDFECFPKQLYSECHFSKELFAYCKACEDVDDKDALDAFVQLHSSSVTEDSDDLLDLFNEHYHGCFDSDVEATADLAEEMLNQYNVPDEVRTYFDYDAYAETRMLADLEEYDGYYFWNL